MTASPRQLTFDELETPLSETTFVIVDLETTGTNPSEDAITEIGAVKVRGGVVLGEMATLVDPGRHLPPHIVRITGITTAMLVGAPRIESVLPTFLEFAEGAVLVAHNAPFDTGFLRAAAARTDTAWPRFTVLCTVKLARRVLTRDEAPSVKLAHLARLFAVDSTPTHRALDDARATVEVLHALIERVGNQGVHSLTELVDYLPDVSTHQRAKRSFASALPQAPGVYLFRGPSEEVLYVGTASDLRRRVRTYFTGSETRGRIKEMVALATRVDHVECVHALEAGVRELRLLAAHTPPYNRRSKYPMRGWWIILTDEPFPRLSIVRRPAEHCLGPFRTRSVAADVADTLAQACGIRTCTTRIRRGGEHGPACPPREVGACPAQDIHDESDYGRSPDLVRALWRGNTDEPLRALRARMEALGLTELFETAARLRDRTAELTRALARMQRLSAFAAIDQLVLARPREGGGWDFAVIRSGRLAAAGIAARGTPPMPVVEQLVLGAETVVPDGTPLRGASPEEAALLLRWAESDGCRIVSASQPWASPIRGAGSWREWTARATAAHVTAGDHSAGDPADATTYGTHR
ncbi:DEDD exonuclease domain-containing protein [Rhodococcus triatomae]|uniref:DEDD exonuclease domain-containing protein n=1 Tax=Rhodococcus triatomae TaxID=300028 RepID=UPI0009F495E8|nr:DEDD exonuclease domain-containing protein [Rhodococcus triatomae]QNG18502.1 DEDD exonuclease domain-containing protein [Rhodococcus triatomae]QNG21829.1 DEDD exonuclease domain-containing protein [Rhodococcus triatomae]